MMVYNDGAVIDAHDAVIRFNAAPTKPRPRSGPEQQKVGPDLYCVPRHGMPLYSIDEGSSCVG